MRTATRRTRRWKMIGGQNCPCSRRLMRLSCSSRRALHRSILYLIFDHLPRSSQAAGARLDLKDLFKQGRTFEWSDLPERLWAATGLSLPGKERFDAFGKLRNGIQHFAPAPDGDAGE